MRPDSRLLLTFTPCRGVLGAAELITKSPRGGMGIRLTNLHLQPLSPLVRR